MVMLPLPLPSTAPSASFVASADTFSSSSTFVCSLAMLLDDRPSFGFLDTPCRADALPTGAFRFELLLGCKAVLPAELVDLSRLITAIADPLLSCFACAMSASSWLSASQQNSHAWTSRDRPLVSRGGRARDPVLGREPVRAEMGGKVITGCTLWLR